MFNFIASWRRERETIRELARLTDRELADLGIARVDIRAVAGGALTTRDDAAPAELRSVMAPAWGAHSRPSLAA